MNEFTPKKIGLVSNPTENRRLVSEKFSLICPAISQFSRNLRDRRTLLAGKDRSDNDRMSEISTMQHTDAKPWERG